ncbi:TonB-dependent receptor [Alistipes sp. D31t1_170403_E11]|uniref:TonB-dependent receptor n=1 Tax=Alistipes sp. D31t1_170403_E11 TaxID=2787128 RepID=UPI00189A99BF|nr:TonB-dependent receptor [Alistipes sp. D31t1_170403_E11]
MKRIFLILAAAALCPAAQLRAEQAETTRTEAARPTGRTEADSLRVYRLQEVEVTATRASKNTPVAYSDITRSEIARNSYGFDIPSVLALTPSMIATNETGIGIGGTSMRLRGTDATRLNVTINGVPMNNPDSHSMYWYDTPDLISAVGTIQVQRGAGISTNGTGAFGGAINMSTDVLQTEFGGDASLSYGSYNTSKQAVHVNSGLMGGHWLVDARLTHIGSDGYIDRGATDLKSYMFQGAYYNGNTMLKLVSFGGKAKTGLTYTGATKEQMRLNGRRFHTEGMYYTSSGPHSYYYMDDGKVERATVGYYDDQTDNYLQINNQLVLSHRFNEKWTLNATGFYTYGYGYYKQYKAGRTLAEYLNLETDIEQADLIREKIMRNHLGGLNASAAYSVKNLDLTFGGSWSYYSCPHWGVLDWVDGLDKSQIGGRWYDNDVDKQDANLFARASWTVAKGLRLFGDLQYRYVSYQTWGVNDNFVSEEVGMQPIDVDETYHFFNPRAGLNYTLGERSNFYFSFAVAQKEPTRSDFTDRYKFAADQTAPSSEKLYDYELGYTYTAPRLSLGVNFYYMKYKDQLVPTGMVNDGDDALNVNVPDSYRRGVELSAAWKIAGWFTASANATFSQNRIENYVDALKNSPTYDQNLGDMTIAYSPSSMAGLLLDFHHKGFEAVLHTQYVGKQYFTNNENDALSLDAYCVTNLNLAYTFRTRSARSVRLGLLINNLFSTEYESNGYGYSYMDTWSGPTPARIDEAFYFPQAPLNVLANVTVRF